MKDTGWELSILTKNLRFSKVAEMKLRRAEKVHDVHGSVKWIRVCFTMINQHK